MRRFFNGISLVSIATLGLGAFVAVATGVSLYTSGAVGFENTQALLAECADELLNNLERRVDSRLKPVSDQAQWIADALAQGHVDMADLRQLDGFMFGALGATPQVRSIGIVTPDGTTDASVPRTRARSRVMSPIGPRSARYWTTLRCNRALRHPADQSVADRQCSHARDVAACERSVPWIPRSSRAVFRLSLDMDFITRELNVTGPRRVVASSSIRTSRRWLASSNGPTA